MYTIWLFTVGDLPTTCLQFILFGLSGVASGRLTTPRTTDNYDTKSPGMAAWTMIGRLHWIFLYVWLCLLVAQLSNQSAAGAPEEDALNKPYRPIPAGRITQHQARYVLMPPAILIALLSSFALGVHWEAAMFIVLVYLLNDFGGGGNASLLRALVLRGGSYGVCPQRRHGGYRGLQLDGVPNAESRRPIVQVVGCVACGYPHHSLAGFALLSLRGCVVSPSVMSWVGIAFR